MGSVSEQRRGCRAGPRLWCRLGPKDQALSGSTQWAACRAQRAVTHRQQLGWGGLTVKGAVGACGCWLGLDLDAYTAAWTHPGSQKGAQERARFSACKLYPNRTTRKLPSPVPDTVGTRGGYRRDTLLGNQPHQSRACAVRPLGPRSGPGAAAPCEAGRAPGAKVAWLPGQREWASVARLPVSGSTTVWERGVSGRQKAGLFWGHAFLLQKQHPRISANRQTDQRSPEESRSGKGWAELGWGLKATQLLGFLSDQMVGKVTW